MEVISLGDDTVRHLKTENLDIWVNEMRDGSFVIECAKLRIMTSVTATSIDEAQQVALKLVEERINWLMQLWLREIRQLTGETNNLTKEMTDAPKANQDT